MKKYKTEKELLNSGEYKNFLIKDKGITFKELGTNSTYAEGWLIFAGYEKVMVSGEDEVRIYYVK